MSLKGVLNMHLLVAKDSMMKTADFLERDAMVVLTSKQDQWTDFDHFCNNWKRILEYISKWQTVSVWLIFGRQGHTCSFFVTLVGRLPKDSEHISFKGLDWHISRLGQNLNGGGFVWHTAN